MLPKKSKRKQNSKCSKPKKVATKKQMEKAEGKSSTYSDIERYFLRGKEIGLSPQRTAETIILLGYSWDDIDKVRGVKDSTKLS